MTTHPRIWLSALAVTALLAIGGWLVLERRADATPAREDATAQAGKPASAPHADGSGRAGGAGEGAPVSVTTVAAQRRDQPVTLSATGTVAPLNVVDVRPQVGNPIVQVHVREGQFVQRGQLLFTLDDRTDQVNVAKARAQLAKDQAGLADAQRQFARSQDLVRQQFVSQSALDTAQTLVNTQQAAVNLSQAAVQAAELALGYDRIAAPSSGRVGAINVYAGSIVQPGGTPLLSITQLDPIAVSFSLPQRYLNDALDGLHEGHTAVQAELPGANRAIMTGTLQFVDSAVDQASGTVRVKAVFANPRQQLWPGAYTNVKLTLSTLDGAIVIPHEAVVSNQEGDAVYVAAEDHTAQLRKIKVVMSAGPDAVVSGIQAGEHVIVDGRRNVRPGSRIVVRDAAAPDAGNPKRKGSSNDAAASSDNPSAAASLS